MKPRKPEEIVEEYDSHRFAGLLFASLIDGKKRTVKEVAEFWGYTGPNVFFLERAPEFLERKYLAIRTRDGIYVDYANIYTWIAYPQLVSAYNKAFKTDYTGDTGVLGKLARKGFFKLECIKKLGDRKSFLGIQGFMLPARIQKFLEVSRGKKKKEDLVKIAIDFTNSDPEIPGYDWVSYLECVR